MVSPRGRTIFKNLLPQNHLAQILEIWYLALPSGPLPGLFSEGLRVQTGPGVQGFKHRNTKKNNQKSSSSEPLASNA